MNYQEFFKKDLEQFESYAKEYFTMLPKESVPGIKKLMESIEYSALEGGKRFRPMLTLLTIEALDENPKQGLPFALAVEFIHSYSLIHDDLPLMDNDDLRRGKPTNHKVFGEAMALLAGDALLTEAFSAIVDGYHEDPKLGLELIATLARASGVRGMVGGQAIDISPREESVEEWQIRYQHSLKTGALIRAAVYGGAIVANALDLQKHSLGEFGKSLGLAFQIADDLEDFKGDQKIEQASFVAILGEAKTREMLEQVSSQARAALVAAGCENSRLAKLIDYNVDRVPAGTA